MTDGSPITDLAFLGSHDEDGDVCRVCRVEGDADMPLIHPCKCSGSVRYVHSDCLKSWLSHTQKRHCEICGYSYTFTKVYPESLPSVIPLAVYFRQAAVFIGKGVAFALRICLVIQTWLITLPIMNMASLTAMLVTAGYLAPSSGDAHADKSVTDAVVGANATASISSIITSHAALATGTITPNETVVHATLSFVNDTADFTGARWTLKSMVVDPVGSILGEIWFLLRRVHKGDNNALFAYVFRGQVLTVLLAGLLMSLIFLREWVLQHDWSQHLPKPKVEADEINPDDWVVLGGVALDQAEYKKRVQAVKVLHKTHTRNARKALSRTAGDKGTQPVAVREAGSSLPIGMPSAHTASHDGALVETSMPLRKDPSDGGRASVDLSVQSSAIGQTTNTPAPALSITDEVEMVTEAPSDTLEMSAPRVAPIGPFVASRRTSLPIDVQRASVNVVPNEDSSASLPLPSQSATASPTPWTSTSPLTDSMTALPSYQDQVTAATPATARPPLAPRPLTQRNSPPRLIDLPFDARHTEAGPSRITIPELRASLAEARLSPGEKSGYDLNWQAPELLSPGPTSSDDRSSTPLDPLPAPRGRNQLKRAAHRTALLDEPRRNPFPPTLDFDPNFETRARAPWASSSTDSLPSIAISDTGRSKGHDESLAITASEGVLPAGGHESPLERSHAELRNEIAGNLDEIAKLELQQRLLREAIDGHRALREAMEENRNLRVELARRLRDRGADQEHETLAEDSDHDEDELDDEEAGAYEQEEVEVVGQVDPPMLDHLAVEDLDDAGFEREDWDGVLEIIGMIGPLTNLLQNFFIAQLIMSSALTLLVGLPMIVGKAVLYTDFVRVAITIVQLAVKGAQVITGPIPQIAWEIAHDVVLVPLNGSFRALYSIVTRELGLAELRSPVDAATTACLRNMLADFAAGFKGYFISIFRHVAHAHEIYRLGCTNIASSDTLSARISSIFAGYGFTLLLLLAIAASADDHSGMLSESMTRRLRVYALFVKLSFFMMIELVIFPLVIGLAINFFTIPLFPGASVLSRILFFRTNPIGGLVINLLGGTMFMFSFAGALQHVRKIARPGALFFIRDPADPDYSPVREIIQRPARSQIRKLGTSALMYVFIVFCVLGVTVWGLHLQPWWKVLPLRIEGYPPLSSVPFDLLFLHLAVPPIMNRIEPRSRLRRMCNWTYRTLAKSFLLYPLLCARLPSQHRSALKESRLSAGYIWPALDIIMRPFLDKYDPTEGLFRVPGSDKAVLLSAAERGRHGVFVHLDTLGRPRTPEGKLTLLKQNRAAIKAGREPQKDYHVVWLPKYWRTRIYVFLFSIVGLSGIGVAFTFLTPLLVGRAALAMLWTARAHDGYALLVGGTICCFAYILGQVAQQQMVAWLRAPRLRRSEISRRVKRFVLRKLVGSYSFVALYGIIPLLLGLIWEVHISVPWRSLRHVGTARILHVWDAWAIGVVQLSLLVTLDPLLLPRARRGERVWKTQLLCRLLRDPFRYKFGTVNRVVLPILGILLLPLVFPVILSLCLSPIFKNREEMLRSFIFPLTFPLVSAAIELWLFRQSVRRHLGTWKQHMIDAEYVLEERVENYEPEAADKQENGTAEAPVGLVKKQKKRGDDDDEWEDVSDDGHDRPTNDLDEDAQDTVEAGVEAQGPPAEVPFDTTWDQMVVETLDDVSDAESSSKTGVTAELEEGEEIRFADAVEAVEEGKVEDGDGQNVEK